MAYPSGPLDPRAADHPGIGGDPLPTVRPHLTVTDVVPIGPNLFATVASFIALILVPWICLHTLETVWEDAIGDDMVASYLILTNLEETLINAAVGAVLFLVIGAILQTWNRHRPFPARRPILVAFPMAWGLIMPESLLHGGSWLSGAIVGAAIALAFGVHWGTLMILSDGME